MVLVSSEYQEQPGVILQKEIQAVLFSARVASMKTPSQKPGRSHWASSDPMVTPMVEVRKSKRITILEGGASTTD